MEKKRKVDDTLWFYLFIIDGGIRIEQIFVDINHCRRSRA